MCRAATSLLTTARVAVGDSATAPNWGLVLQSGLAGAAVIALFWAGLHAMEPERRNRRRNPTR